MRLGERVIHKRKFLDFEAPIHGSTGSILTPKAKGSTNLNYPLRRSYRPKTEIVVLGYVGIW